MNKSAECEYRGPADDVSEAIKIRGVPRGTRSCSHPCNKTDKVCDFLDIDDPSLCPAVLHWEGSMDLDELVSRLIEN